MARAGARTAREPGRCVLRQAMGLRVRLVAAVRRLGRRTSRADAGLRNDRFQAGHRRRAVRGVPGRRRRVWPRRWVASSSLAHGRGCRGSPATLFIVPGLKTGSDSTRLGRRARRGDPACSARRGESGNLFVLPGTHSKWMMRSPGGRIESFQTYMTGELFELLRTHSSLGPRDGYAAVVARGLPARRVGGPRRCAGEPAVSRAHRRADGSLRGLGIGRLSVGSA